MPGKLGTQPHPKYAPLCSLDCLMSGPWWHQINDSTEQSSLPKGDMIIYRLGLAVEQEKPKLLLDHSMSVRSDLGFYNSMNRRELLRLTLRGPLAIQFELYPLRIQFRTAYRPPHNPLPTRSSRRTRSSRHKVNPRLTNRHPGNTYIHPKTTPHVQNGGPITL